MHISILLMEQIIELFIMILMGFIIVKAGIVKDEDSKVLSKIVLYLIIPCVIINAFPGGLHFKNSERSFDCICGIGDFAVSFAVYHFCYGQAFPYE